MKNEQKPSRYKRKNPIGFNGTEKTSHQLHEILPDVLKFMENQFQDRGDRIIAAWPSIIGPQLSPMTQALSFNHGVLLVKVKNSTLYGILVRQEKARILTKLKQQFPNTEIKAISFRIG